MSDNERNTPAEKAKTDRSHLWKHEDVQIKHEGKEIILPAQPEDMDIPSAITALQRRQEDEETTVNTQEEIEGFPLDSAVAFMKAMQEMFGWASPVPTPGFFGPQPPTFLGVEIGLGETTQVILGKFALPNLKGNVRTVFSDGSFYIVGKTAKRQAYVIKELAKLTRKILREESIYKGKALSFRTNSDGDLDTDFPPKFIDTATIDLNELILNVDVKEMVNTAIFTPVIYTEQCRKVSIPLNRGVLLEGKYGVGKTMIARCAAKICQEHGWTFLLLDKAQSLTDALTFARRYSPAMVFCEDIDRVTNVRDDKANDLLNTIDGILTKDSEVIAVMTTNHVDKINPAMLRPGRLDSVISVHTPDSIAVQELIQVYARGLLEEGTILERVGKELAGQIPATIREAVERSKLRAIPKINGSGLHINEDDLLAAAREMKGHLALLETKSEPHGMELIMQGISEVLADTAMAKEVAEGNEFAKDALEALANRLDITL